MLTFAVGKIWKSPIHNPTSGQGATTGVEPLTTVDPLLLNRNINDVHRSDDKCMTFRSSQSEDSYLPNDLDAEALLQSEPDPSLHQPSASFARKPHDDKYPAHEPTITNFVLERGTMCQPDNFRPHSSAQENTKEGVPDAYLPFKIQHELLGNIQTLIEETCFYFTQKWLPEVLERKGWSTPEQGELTSWWALLQDRYVPPQAIAFGAIKASVVFQNCRRIRNCAVHRLPVSIPGIKLMIWDAMGLICGFKDVLREAKLRKLQDCLERRDLDALERSIDEPLANFLLDSGNGTQDREITEVSLSLPAP